jgi:tRNA(Ile)-lysidine synthase TilS/MesJ
MGAIILVDQLVAGQHSLAGVDDDDVVTAVNVGGVLNLVLALQQGSSGGSHAAQGLAGGVQDVPFTFNGLVLCHESGHVLFLRLYFNKIEFKSNPNFFGFIVIAYTYRYVNNFFRKNQFTIQVLCFSPFFSLLLIFSKLQFYFFLLRICLFFSKIMSGVDVMRKLLSLMRKCMKDYRMISPGDRVAVGVSGGKDSLALLRLMAELRDHSPIPFELLAITLDMGYEEMDFSPVADLCHQLAVPYTLRKTQIREIVFDIRKEENPCALCAKLRRGILNETAVELGANKVALGHHYDDAIETFALSLIYEGRLNSFLPVTYLDRTGLTLIRPMLYVHEKSIANFVQRQQLPLIHNPCPADKNTRREDVKALLYELEGRYPGLKDNIFGGLQRSPLPGWQPHKDNSDNPL